MANSVERYYQRKKRRKKRAKVVLLGLLFALMLIVLAILSVTVFFNAEEIRVEGHTRYTTEEILEVGGLKVGQNLFRLNKFEVIDKMESLPYIKKVSIDRKLPNTLVVSVEENEPVVWVPAPGGAALLNEEYRVLEIVPLPLPPGEEDLAEGEIQEIDSPVEGIPQLTETDITDLTVGKTAVLGEADYTGFLKRLYEGFEGTELKWNMVNEVQFFARYDIKLLYSEHITIDFGTLDQVKTKLKLAAYLLNENGMSQSAILDVSNPERVYYRPKK